VINRRVSGSPSLASGNDDVVGEAGPHRDRAVMEPTALGLFAYRGMASATGVARSASSSEVDGYHIANLRSSREASYCFSDLDHRTAYLVAGSNRIYPLFAGEESSLHGAEPARSYLDEDLIGSQYERGLIAKLDHSRCGKHCNSHDRPLFSSRFLTSMPDEAMGAEGGYWRVLTVRSPQSALPFGARPGRP
jgi:hypothetical protein